MGPDNISQKILKTTIWNILTPLTNIINATLSTGIFPDKLKLAKVVPIYKNGTKDNPSNYRPISILSCLSKIFERILYGRLYKFLHKNSFFTNSQYGFLKNRSTEDAILELQNTIIDNITNNTTSSALFLDLSKAFDTINHSILLNKLNYYGVRGIALSLFTNYLQNRAQYVEINSTKSTLLSITTGVPQGSILGPLLFLIYVNDLPLSVTSPIILFADDTSVIIKAKSSTTLHNEISNTLSIMEDWFAANKLSINANKSKLMLFSQYNITNIPIISIANNNIEQVKNFKLLGIIINDRLSWKTHITYISNKILKVIYIIRSIKTIVSNKTLCTIYTALIQPHLLYGIISWYDPNNKQTNRINILQKKVIRLITNSKYNSHTYHFI